MLQYQQAYQAMAQVIQASGTMFTSLITAIRTADTMTISTRHFPDECPRRQWRRSRPRSPRRRPSSRPASKLPERRRQPRRHGAGQPAQHGAVGLAAVRQQRQSRRPRNLQLEKQALTGATNSLQSARDLAVEANNSSLTASQRQDIATQLQQLQQALVGTANATDASGNYLFAGTASAPSPSPRAAPR